MEYNFNFKHEIEESLKKQPINTHMRLWDLVRYQRAELHQAGLIDDEEYAFLLTTNGGSDSARRLEDYDRLRKQLDDCRAQLAASNAENERIKGICETFGLDKEGHGVMWVCFHCGKEFNDDEHEQAAEHFGVENGPAWCQKENARMREALEKAQEQLRECRTYISDASESAHRHIKEVADLRAQLAAAQAELMQSKKFHIWHGDPPKMVTQGAFNALLSERERLEENLQFIATIAHTLDVRNSLTPEERTRWLNEGPEFIKSVIEKRNLTLTRQLAQAGEALAERDKEVARVQETANAYYDSAQAFECQFATAQVDNRKMREALEEIRDAVLNQRGPLEGYEIDNHFINAVLGIIDDAWPVDAALAPASEPEHDAQIRQIAEEHCKRMGPILDAIADAVAASEPPVDLSSDPTIADVFAPITDPAPASDPEPCAECAHGVSMSDSPRAQAAAERLKQTDNRIRYVGQSEPRY